MQYREIPQLTRSEVIALLQTDDANDMTIALLSASLFDDDPTWSEKMCVKYLCHRTLDVKLAALMGLGHIARIHDKLDLQVVLPKLAGMEKDSTLAGRVSDTLDDIRMFVGDGS